MGVVDDLRHARSDFERGEWVGALEVWDGMDASSISADDLCSAGTAAILLGRHDVAMQSFQRAFERYLAAGNVPAAVRRAFHLTMVLLLRGETSGGLGWLARGQRLAAALPDGDLERGYLAFAQMFAHITTGRVDEAQRCAVAAADAARRHEDRDLLALGLCSQGRIAIYSERVGEGLALLDEAMLEVTGGGLDPVITGQIYCTAIEGCQEIADYSRVTQWTRALDAWCSAQPGLVAFVGQCSLHRGQIFRAYGAWDEALDEFAAAIERYRRAGSQAAIGLAAAERGDLLRLRGDAAGADDAYRLAADHGHDPQPGLALLWLMRGELQPAVAAARRVLAESPTSVARSRVLPGVIEILVAGGDLTGARAAADELQTIATSFGTEPLLAQAATCAGVVQLSDGDPAGALPYLRKARAGCARLEMPYAAGVVALATARALLAMGDEQSAARDLQVARAAFERVGARVDLGRVDELLGRPARPQGLSEREIEILQLVASGRSNAQIATALVLSEHTVARHLSNIFTKIGVANRTAAAAFAFDHGLLTG